MCQIKAQDVIRRPTNSLSVTVGGQNLYYSFNYRKVFYDKGMLRLHGGIYIMPFSTNSLRNSFYDVSESVSIHVGGVWGAYRYYLGLGSGYSYRFFGSRELRFFKYVEIGYRHQIESNGTFFKVSLTPTAFTTKGEKRAVGFIPWGGVTVGKVF